MRTLINLPGKPVILSIVANQTGGSLTEVSTAIGVFAVGGRTSVDGVGIYIMSGGTLTANGGIRVGGTGTGTFNQSGGTVFAKAGVNIARIAGSTGTYNLNGGTLSTFNVTSSTSVNCVFNFNGSVLQALLPANPWVTSLSEANVLAGGAIIDTVTNSVRITQVLLDGGTGGGLIKLGSGALYLEGSSAYIGATIVSNGMLAGVGTISSPILVTSTGAIGAGDAGTTVGTLTVKSNVTIQSSAFFRISKTGGVLTNDVITGITNAQYGGTLTVTNVTSDATVLVAGDSFRLFSANSHSGNFSTVVGSPGSGLVYNFANGVLSVASAVAANPTNITMHVSGSLMSLSWPADHLGWYAQSNSTSLTTPSAWHDITGSQTVTNLTITINPAQPKLFFRLRSP